MTSWKIGSDTWAFREQKLRDFVPALGSLGFKCINLSSISGACSHVLPEHSSYRLEVIQRICVSNGLPIAAVHTGMPLVSANRDEQEDAIDLVRRYVEMCKLLSTRTIIIDLSGLSTGDSIDQVVKRSRWALRECADIAAAANIALAIESAADTATNTPELDRKLIDVAERPNLGANYNVGNICASGQDAEAAIETLSGKILNVHLKDVTARKGKLTCCAVGEGAVNFGAILAKLSASGYAGPLVIEYEGDVLPLAGVKKSIEHLQSVLIPRGAGPDQKSV